MTNQEKIDLLKTTIEFLYTKEGRAKAYIARLLGVDRKLLTYSIKRWELKQANVSYLTPSNKKFVNKHRNLIKSRLDNNTTQIDIAKELKVTPDYLINIIHKDTVLNKANEDYSRRKSDIATEKRERCMQKSRLSYDITDRDNEVWVEIMGYEGYFISNYGRVKKYKQTYDSYALVKSSPNSVSGREYVKLGGSNIQVARLVGFNFVTGHSDINNTIDHIDGDISNNHFSNLAWVSQSTNNARAYKNGRSNAIAYAKHGKFKSIIVDSKYEFKTIRAMAKFIGVSETQAHRYIDGDTACNHKIELIY